MSETWNKSPRLFGSAHSLEEFVVDSGMLMEHVHLEAEDEIATCRKIRKCFEFKNIAKEVTTVFEVFDDGFLRITENCRRVSRRSFGVDLKHLESRPLTSRSGHGVFGICALLSAVFAFVAVLLAYINVYRSPMIAIAIAAATLAFVAARMFFLRIEERIAFRTQHGRAVVHIVATNFGCIRKGRAIGRRLSVVIRREGRRNQATKEHRLRDEIREHYRLAETGVISRQACKTAIQRALAHFD